MPPRPVLLLSLMLDQGGTERQLAEMALALDRSRYQPWVGTFRPHGLRAEELRAAGVPVEHFPVTSFRSAGALAGAFQLRRFIRQHGIQLVHAFDAPMAVFATPVVHYSTRAVMVSSQRNHRTLTPEYHRLLRFTDRRVSGIVVNCQYMKRHLMHDEGVAENLIHVCYNGIDLERFPAGAPRTSPAALAGANRVIGTLCALRPEKDLHTLIDAFHRLEPKTNELRLVIVGSGSERDGLMQHAQRLGIFEQCVFQPATAEIGEWLRAMDIFVLPSRDEAFSNSIMEAMLCGSAVVASNVGGNPELVDPECRGLLFPPGDVESLAAALSRLLGDEVLRSQLAQAGETFVRETLSRPRAAGRLADIYDLLLSRRS